jgi:hypothetical protein
MSRHIAVHGTGAIPDNAAPFNVRISYTPEGSHVTAPAGLPAASFPYSGNVYFVFQSPPITPGASFNITGLTAYVTLALSSIERVNMHSGAGLVLDVAHPPPNPVDLDLKKLSASNIPESQLSGNSGLCVTYTIRFNGPTSSANFAAVDIEYKP